MSDTTDLAEVLKPIGEMIGAMARAQDDLVKLLARKGVITDDEVMALVSIVDQAFYKLKEVLDRPSTAG